MFSRISIRTKITTVIAFLLVAMTAMGLLAAVRQIQSINTNAVDLQTNWLPSVRAIGDLQMGMMRYRILLRDHLRTADATKKAAIETKIQIQDKENERLAKVFKASLHLRKSGRSMKKFARPGPPTQLQYRISWPSPVRT